MTPISTTFEVRDVDLPGRPALTGAADLGSAVEQVQRLHGQFREQLATNGEGGAGRIWQRLVVLEQRTDGEPVPCYWSSTNGLRPRPSSLGL